MPEVRRAARVLAARGASAARQMLLLRELREIGDRRRDRPTSASARVLTEGDRRRAARVVRGRCGRRGLVGLGGRAGFAASGDSAGLLLRGGGGLWRRSLLLAGASPVTCRLRRDEANEDGSSERTRISMGSSGSCLRVARGEPAALIPEVDLVEAGKIVVNVVVSKSARRAEVRDSDAREALSEGDLLYRSRYFTREDPSTALTSHRAASIAARWVRAITMEREARTSHATRRPSCTCRLSAQASPVRSTSRRADGVHRCPRGRADRRQPAGWRLRASCRAGSDRDGSA